MIIKIKAAIKKNTEVFALFVLIIITVISTNYYNYNKKKILNEYKNLINNIYVKKSIINLFDNLEPKFKKIIHQVSPGESLANILKQYNTNDKDIDEIRSKLSQKFKLKKLKTGQKIQFTIDQEKNLIKEFIIQISNTEKIALQRDIKTKKFNQKILITKLNKKVIYKENIILDSLYRAATKEKIPANVIIEFARIYGFQVDFQRDIRKKDSFQMMYEVFVNDKKKVIETGNILFANLKLSGENLSLYYFDGKGSEGHYDKNGKSVKKH